MRIPLHSRALVLIVALAEATALCGCSGFKFSAPPASQIGEPRDAERQRFAGSYYWIVPGSTWTLTLHDSGSYDLTTRGSFQGSVTRPIESGRWVFNGLNISLASETAPVGDPKQRYRELYVLRDTEGGLALVSELLNQGGPGLAFHFVFIGEDAFSRFKEATNSEPKE